MTTYVPQAEPVFTVEAMCEPPRSLGERGGGRMLMVPITGGTVAGATHMVAAQQEILQGTDVGLALVVRTYPIAK